MGGENNYFTTAYIFVHSEIFQHCLDGDGLLRNLIGAVSEPLNLIKKKGTKEPN